MGGADCSGPIVTQQQTYLPLLALNLICCLSKYRGREVSVKVLLKENS